MMRLNLLLFSFLCCLFPLLAVGQTSVDNRGNWHNANNWNNGVPDINDALDWSIQNSTLTISNADGSALSVDIGQFGNTLIVSNGRTLTVDGDFISRKDFTLNIIGNSEVIIGETLNVDKDFVANVEAGSSFTVKNVVTAKDATLTIAGNMTVVEDFHAGNGVVVNITGSMDVGDEFTTGSNPSITIDGGLLSAGSVDTGGVDITTTNGGGVASDDCSGVGNGDTVCDSTLPVVLSLFYGTKANTANILHWTTYTEINSEYFEIQRAGIDRDFTTLGTVAGSGNSKTTQHYTWADEKPLIGLNYYRLVSNDFDGYSEFFDPIAMEFEPESFTLNMHPNPATAGNRIHINTYGQMARCSMYRLDGANILNDQPVIDHLNIPAWLSPGIYLCSINLNGLVKQVALIVK